MFPHLGKRIGNALLSGEMGMTSGLWHFPGHGRAGVGAVEGGMGRGGG